MLKPFVFLMFLRVGAAATNVDAACGWHRRGTAAAPSADEVMTPTARSGHHGASAATHQGSLANTPTTSGLSDKNSVERLIWPYVGAVGAMWGVVRSL